MAATGTGSQHSAALVSESTYGTTPTSPTFIDIRHTDASIGLSRTSLESAELRTDRQIAHFRLGNKSVAGGIPFELSYGSHDSLFEAAMAGTFSGSLSITATTLSVAAGDNSYNDSGTALPLFTVGDKVITTGFGTGANNATSTVVTSTTSKLVVSGTTLVTEAAGATATIQADGDKVKVGTTRRSFTIERKFADLTIPEWHRYTGCEIDGFSLSVAPDALVTGTFNVIAQDLSIGTAILSGATYGTATTTEPFDSFNGTITEGGGAIAIVTAVDLTLENGLNPLFTIGSSTTSRPSIGKSRVTGSLTTYFQSKALMDKFINETASSLVFTLTDPAGNSNTYTIPNIKYTGGQPDTSGEGEITISFPFQALYDSTELSNLTIERNPI